VKQVILLAIAVFCAGSVPVHSLAASTTAAVQVSQTPDSTPAPPAKQQEQRSRNSIWFWMAVAVVGTIVVTVPYLIIVGVAFRISLTELARRAAGMK